MIQSDQELPEPNSGRGASIGMGIGKYLGVLKICYIFIMVVVTQVYIFF